MTLSSLPSVDSHPAAIARQFLLDPEVAFFNHGSFGACPKPVFETYQQWQRTLELEPVNFIHRILPDALDTARDRLAAYVRTTEDKIIFVPNATYGINVVARSISLQPGDEVLSTNHEYGAVNNTWQYVCEKCGADYVRAEIDLPVLDADSVVEAIWSNVSAKTRVICVSHITAPTALIFPIAEICGKAREEGILTVIDGAHAPGQIELNLDALDADYYTGNAHKWLCAPKGCAFLHSRQGADTSLEPLVVSHGWQNGDSDSRLQNYFGWTGTCDPSAYLSIPAAIDFLAEYNWPSVRDSCHTMASNTRHAIEEMTGLPPVSPDSSEWYSQMFTAFMPDGFDRPIREKLWQEQKIEVPIGRFDDQPMIRVSIQGYNTQQDVDRLLSALNDLINA